MTEYVRINIIISEADQSAIEQYSDIHSYCLRFAVSLSPTGEEPITNKGASDYVVKDGPIHEMYRSIAVMWPNTLQQEQGGNEPVTFWQFAEEHGLFGI